MEKLYVHEDSTEKTSTDVFVHLLYSLVVIIAYVRFYRANQLYDILFSPFTRTVVQKVCGDLHASSVVLLELL